MEESGFEEPTIQFLYPSEIVVEHSYIFNDRIKIS